MVGPPSGNAFRAGDRAMPPPPRPVTPPPAEVHRESSLAGGLLRIWWMIAGNAAMAILLLLIFKDAARKPVGVLDAAYAAAAGLCLAARYLEIRFYKGLDATGDAEATMGDFAGYAVALLLLAAGAWAAARYGARLL